MSVLAMEPWKSNTAAQNVGLDLSDTTTLQIPVDKLFIAFYQLSY